MPFSAMSVMARLAFDWGRRCFTQEHMINLPLRSFRVAEEAIELAQACGAPLAMMHRLVDQVYSRPKGDHEQEIGGTLLTACAFCVAIGKSPEEMFERELTRVLAKDPSHFATRNKGKMDLQPLKDMALTSDLPRS